MRQTLLLMVVAALGLAGVAFLAVSLLARPSAAPDPAGMPATVPAVPSAAVQNTLAPRQLLPAGCEPIYGSLVEAPGADVVDGQTLDVVIGQTHTRVRLAGLRLAWNAEQPSADETAVAEIRGMIDGQPVVVGLDGSAPDAQGRLPVYLFSNGWFINQELILRGAARADASSPGQACAALFQGAEKQAQKARAGIWQPTTVPTATFIPTVQFDPAAPPPCDCMARPECGDFRTHDEAQACYNACNDYNSRLDDDRDGLACEWLP